MGGEVPRSYYVSNSKPVPKEGMQSLEIGSGSRKNLEFEIGAANSVLRYILKVSFFFFFKLAILTTVRTTGGNS